MSSLKRTPFTSRSQLQSKSGLTSKKPINKRSKKMVEIYRERAPLVERLLSERPICEFEGCTHISTEVHEILSRARGGDILDERNCMVLCHAHHDWITSNPLAAERRNYLRSSYDRQSVHDLEDYVEEIQETT